MIYKQYLNIQNIVVFWGVINNEYNVDIGIYNKQSARQCSGNQHKLTKYMNMREVQKVFSFI
jgi:hypothetical protein